MLKQRIITALVLVGILAIVLTVAAPSGFPVFALVLVGVVVYEWLLLLALSRPLSIAVAAATMIVIWLIDSSNVAERVALVAWALAAIAWAGLAFTLFVTGRFPSPDRGRAVHGLLALLLPCACWFALVAAYRLGLVYLVSILAIVWAADIAAYFAGRAFGKRKLAPSISPGKTWAGAIGGAVAAVVVALVCIGVPALSNSFFARLGWSMLPVLIVALVLAALSIVGDLFESQLKRHRGVKDSSRLLPGHGGVFDRVDALLPIVPIALLLQHVA